MQCHDVVLLKEILEVITHKHQGPYKDRHSQIPAQELDPGPFLLPEQGKAQAAS